MTAKIQELINENAQLKAQVKDLEASWKKVEGLLGGSVDRAKRAVRSRAKKAVRKVEKAIDQVTR
ncbi:MAG TPA: hypothetical protein VG245_06160 [Candidatus Dormibacteraeota bacterium]|nr:hypothetical protein [Candidatus Dormibacteraeota bacterium]